MGGKDINDINEENNEPNFFFNLSQEKRNRLFRLVDGKRSILAMALVYELVSRIMSMNYASYTFVH